MISKDLKIVIVASIFVTLAIIVVLAAIPKDIYDGSRFAFQNDTKISVEVNMKNQLMEKLNNHLNVRNEKWSNITKRMDTILQEKEEEIKDQLTMYEKVLRMHSNLETIYHNVSEENLTASDNKNIQKCLIGKEELNLSTLNLSIAKSRDCLHLAISKFREIQNAYQVNEPVEKLNWSVSFLNLKNESEQCVMTENGLVKYETCLVEAGRNADELFAKSNRDVDMFYNSFVIPAEELLGTMRDCRQNSDYPTVMKLVEMNDCIGHVRNHGSSIQIVSTLLLFFGALVLVV